MSNSFKQFETPIKARLRGLAGYGLLFGVGLNGGCNILCGIMVLEFSRDEPDESYAANWELNGRYIRNEECALDLILPEGFAP